MSVKMRQRVERLIARRFILDALAAGYTMAVDRETYPAVDDGEEVFGPFAKVRDVLNAMFSVAEEHLVLYREGKHAGWVFFIYGNSGWDVVNDYSTSLAPIMAGAIQLADKYS